MSNSDEVVLTVKLQDLQRFVAGAAPANVTLAAFPPIVTVTGSAMVAGVLTGPPGAALPAPTGGFVSPRLFIQMMMLSPGFPGLPWVTT